jgi:hypothetical protein
LAPREADSHIPLPHSFCKDGSTLLLLSGKVPASIHIAIATQGKHHASLHLADLGRPSYLGPSPSGDRLHELPPLFDGHDDETFPRRSCPVFGTAQIPILEGVEIPFQRRDLYAGESLQETSQARCQSPAKVQSLPWKIALIVDSTLQHRASLHPENAKRFNHGNGFVIGHQWTNIVLIINDMLIPLRPIPFYSQRYCRDHDLAYQTEHDLVIDSLRQLDLGDYVGLYDPRDVVVLTDSGYDNKKIETAIANKGGNFIIALGKTRSVKSETLYLTGAFGHSDVPQVTPL